MNIKKEINYYKDNMSYVDRGEDINSLIGKKIKITERNLKRNFVKWKVLLII